ncbi:MAG: hypothetical protein ACJ8FY_09715 [Gemmataceae bacterium]
MEAPSQGIGPRGETFQQLLAFYGAPAYIRRAQQVREALAQILARSEVQRQEWLSMVRTRLALLRGYVGDWDRLTPWLTNEEQVRVLSDLEAQLQPRLAGPAPASSSPRLIRRALAELVDSLERFNRRWREHVEAIDMTSVNQRRDDYNRNYLLEKECAVRSAHAARQGFHPLPPLTIDDLRKLLPELPVPKAVN